MTTGNPWGSVDPATVQWCQGCKRYREHVGYYVSRKAKYCPECDAIIREVEAILSAAESDIGGAS